jgi:hypothetical protein
MMHSAYLLVSDRNLHDVSTHIEELIDYHVLIVTHIGLRVRAMMSLACSSLSKQTISALKLVSRIAIAVTLLRHTRRRGGTYVIIRKSVHK